MLMVLFLLSVFICGYCVVVVVVVFPHDITVNKIVLGGSLNKQTN